MPHVEVKSKQAETLNSGLHFVGFIEPFVGRITPSTIPFICQL
jgi:hypothetical protein